MAAPLSNKMSDAGVMSKGGSIVNINTSKRIKVPRLVRMHADELEDINEAGKPSLGVRPALQGTLGCWQKSCNLHTIPLAARWCVRCISCWRHCGHVWGGVRIGRHLH